MRGFMRLMSMCALAYIVLVSSVSYAQEQAENTFCEDNCTVVIHSDQKGELLVHNAERATTRFTPYSTFKVPNTLIALDTEAIPSLSTPLTYDKTRYLKQPWWPDIWYENPLIIRDAFQNSAVPIYQQLAHNMGEDTMTQYLAKFDYGNQDISSGLDTFWLNGSIQISAAEQVEFLKRLFKGKLGLKDSTYQDMRKIMLVEDRAAYVLYAKTGGGGTGVSQAIGWYVGVVETQDDRFYFAVNVTEESFTKVQKPRISIALEALKQVGALK